MPGHIKKSEGPDPDPSEWLYITEEVKNKLKLKPYDSKKSCWVPDKATGGFLEGLIETTDGAKVTVKILETGESKTFKKDVIGQVNPPKFDGCVDMTNMTYLHDACVLWNSTCRYMNNLIYTYSGLFCIAINPYVRFPIYTQRAMDIYVGKRKNETPPHIFAVAEGSFQGMQNGGRNQSILITGESGAGKTENTKKVISYFAMVGSSGKLKEGEAGLEEKVVQTNPVLEAWGNAKTVRNDNSSRFGKFIRIWFNQAGKLSGADMVVYLLEKSRLTFQAELERCYHSFYNIMSGQVPDIKAKCLLSDDIYDYWWVSQGKVTVESIDDKEDMMYAHEAYDILGFGTETTYNIYKLTAVVMHMGNLTKDFVPVGKEEQAEIKKEDNALKVAELCGIDPEWMMTYFCKPKLKVGGEWVVKGQTCAQASNGVAGIGRSIYERVFRYIVDKCNEVLIDPTMKKVQYIGCLDIAGFEIFDYNGFEQICINFCNEKLQQFFNQHMFILEQEEYVREGIEWTNVDFGMDLAATIEMFEKPMGFWAIFEEESLFPKATDMTFCNKLHENLLGKTPMFLKPNPKPDPNAHFAISHYAAVVSYNLTAWLEKNKDPLNDTVIELFKNGTNPLLVQCFKDHPGQPLESKKDDRGARKKSAGKTVSAFYKGQLDDLMKVLYATEPSFIRCVVPNTHKKPKMIEPGLIMHQYRCNGVLAGIAICKKGFPNKQLYVEFKQRYNILAAKAVAKAKNDKLACKAVLDAIKLDKEKYRLGHTKVFFRAGTLGWMEEVREDRIGDVLSYLQSQARGKASRMIYEKMKQRKLALYCCQKTIRNYYIGKTWLWWHIWLALKPNLKCSQFAKYKAEFEKKIEIAEKNIDKAISECNKVKAEHERLDGEKSELQLALQSGGSAVQDIVDKTNRLEAMKNDIQKQLDDCLNRIATEEESVASLEQSQGKTRGEKEKLTDDIKSLEANVQMCEEDKTMKDEQIRTLKEELAHQEEMIQKLHKEKRGVGDNKQQTEEELQALEDKANHMNKLKARLEQGLDEIEDSLEREKKSKNDVEKIKRRLEGDLKLTQETVADLERVKNELQNVIQRKEKELQSIGAKSEDEQTLGSKYSKQIKELQCRLEELDEELVIERQSRAKAEKSRQILARDIEDMGQRLEDAGNNTSSQIELNKKREAELARLKEDLNQANLGHEGTLAALRQKHNNMMTELGEQIETLNKMKGKAERDKANMERDLQETRASLEEAMRDRANVERQGKMLQGSINEGQNRLDELARALNDAEAQKKMIQAEGLDLERQIEETEKVISALNLQKTSLTTQLDDNKRLADAEQRDYASLLSKFKNMNTELESIKDRIEEEAGRKSDFLSKLSRAQAEMQTWKSKYETEGVARVEDLEGDRSKLTMRINEAEETIESLNVKISTTEKQKHRMEADLEDMQLEYERVHAAAVINEKRGRNFDKVIGEWKAKVDDLTAEVEASQAETRNYSSELFRLKSAWDEAVEQLDIVKRENKNLADEIKDLLDQLSDGGRSIHELEKQRRRLEVEKEELQAALEEAEAALEQEENKVLRAQLELGQVKQEIERKIKEKEEEFENTRKNHERAMDSLSASMEAETRAKLDALRMKKKLETDINELEIALDQANKANAEAHKSIKRSQTQLRDVEQSIGDEARAKNEIMEKCGLAERKANALQGEMEEARALLDSAERGKQKADMELTESRNAVAEMTAINSKAGADKRNLESRVHTLHAEMDDLMREAKNNEEKAKKAMVDAARLADELRKEQEHNTTNDKACRILENQVGELDRTLADVEANAARYGRAALAKLESKIRDLEMNLADNQRKTADTLKGHQKAERHVKELEFQIEEDVKNMERMQELSQKLQQKIRTYKKQIEDAEEIAALNLAKYRKAQQEMEEAEERSKLAETQLSSARMTRAGSFF